MPENIEAIVNRSFLSRVPALMAADLTLEAAIKQAFEIDEAFIIRLQLANDGARCGLDKPAEEVIRLLSASVYHRLRDGS